jgi:CRP-like cAMP-binding protein
MLLQSKVSMKNRLLSALLIDEYNRLRPGLEPIDLPQGKILYDPYETIQYIYFPNTAIVSLLAIAKDGTSVEVGLIGYEGLAGLASILGRGKTPYRALVQVAGDGMRVRAEIFNREFKRSGAISELVMRYTAALIVQISQMAFCNRFHRLEERLCHWLLSTHDRTSSNILPYTQELLAQMLGANRPDITKAIRKIEERRLVNQSRGQIAIMDRPGLEDASCECYRIIKNEFDEFLGK